MSWSDPDAIYEATTSFASGRLPERPNLVVREGWRARGDDPVVVAHPDHFRLAPDDVIRRQGAAILEALAGRASAADTPAETPPPAEPEPVETDDSERLPGDRTWPQIEREYRRLAGEPAGWRNRRRRPDEPSRPELAKALGVSPATLKRACAKAGKGTTWPPDGF